MKAAHEMVAETQTVPSGALHELDGPLALEGFQPVLAKRGPESQTERRASLVRYLAAICIGIVGTLAWHSYGEATKQTAATMTSEASELGWSPESNLARWVQQLEWTKQPAAAVWTRHPPLFPCAHWVGGGRRLSRHGRRDRRLAVAKLAADREQDVNTFDDAVVARSALRRAEARPRVQRPAVRKSSRRGQHPRSAQ